MSASKYEIYLIFHEILIISNTLRLPNYFLLLLLFCLL
jgi:hypothetical protein